MSALAQMRARPRLPKTMPLSLGHCLSHSVIRAVGLHGERGRATGRQSSVRSLGRQPAGHRRRRCLRSRRDVNIEIEFAAGPFRSGLARVKKADGTFCTLGPSGCTTVPYPVTITDDDLPTLSLAAAPTSIAEEDNSTTTVTVENVSTVTVEITNGKTFAEDQDGHADLLRGRHPGHPLQREPGGHGYKRDGPPGGSGEGDRLG